MKKLLSMLLSLAMLFSLGITAFAAEDTAVGIIGGADGPTSIMITGVPAAGGAVLEAPDLENMTEAELDAYFLQLESQYEAELAAMQAEQKAQMIAAARSLMPYQTGVNVWLNGGYMTFADALPVVKDGRTQVPFRAILEAMGAIVSYDNGNIEAVFEDGSVMKLAIGSHVMTYAHGENNTEVTTVDMDAAPFMDEDTGRTYVPVRFIGEALGLTVTWDPELWVAYIVDWDQLEAELDAQFSAFNEMLATAAAVQQDLTKTYKTTENIVISGTLDGQSKDPLELSLKGETLTRGQNMSGSYKVGIDMGGYKPVLHTYGEEAVTALEELDGKNLELIFNMEQGIYLRSALLAQLTGGMAAETDWLQVAGVEDMASIYGAAGVNMNNLITQATAPGFTMGKLIRVLCEDGTLGTAMGYMAPDMAARYFAVIYEAIFGNDAITVSGMTTKNYTLKFDMDSLLNSMVEAELITADEADSMKAELKAAGLELSMVMKLTAKNGGATNSSVIMKMEMEGMSFSMNITGTSTTSKGNILIDVDGVCRVEIDLDSKLTITDTQQVQTAPAAGERVVTLREVTNAFAPMLEE